MTPQPLGLREGHAPCSFALGASRWRCSLGYPHSMGIGKKWAPLATMDFELKKNGALVFFEPRKVRFKPTKGKGRKSYQKNNWHSRSKDTQPRIEGRIYQHPPCTNPSWGTHQPGWSPMLTLWPCFIWAEIFSGATKGCLSSRRWIQINISNISSPVTASMISGWTQNRVDIRLKLRVLILLRSQLRPGKPCLAWGTCSFPPGDDWNE